jgi:predicted NAD/FAD-binding protein
MKKKLAIVGSGISGMICAYYLKDDYEISIFEKNDYLGGHTHTHSMTDEGKNFTLDTGFIVFNLHTYPTLLKLFKDIGVEKQESDMSFAVYNKKINLQYSGGGIGGIFAQKKNIFSPKFWRLLIDINRFFKYALKEKDEVGNTKETIREYCKRHNLSDYFMDNYLVPMASAVWSTPHEEIYDFPMDLIIPFFFNHGLLSATEHFQWYVVKGGSDTYTRRIVELTSPDVHLNEKVESTEEKDKYVHLVTNKGEYKFDKVILACHSDESINIAKNIPKKKRDMLKQFSYNSNIAVLHTDDNLMPPIKRTWSSWNHTLGEKKKGKTPVSTVYWLNRLQNPDTNKDYFLSINPFQEIDKKKIIKTIKYNHPLFTRENFALQKNLQELNKDTRIYFAGAYFRYGFHEDGAKSGMNVVDAILKKGREK